jgi:thiamine kinase-like enzyme
METSSHSVTAAPGKIAAGALGVDVSEVQRVERIKHGLTNDSWRVQTAHGAVIVRLSNTAEQALQIDRQSEARVLALVAAAGLGPEVLMCDPARHVLVTREAGHIWTEADAHVAGNIERVAGILRQLHALGTPSEVRRVDLAATVRGYLAALQERGHHSQLTVSATRARAENAALALRQHGVECLCHNDVHSLNIVDNGALRLIDWEYSGIGERMFDLASICVYHGYARHERDRLLDAYLQHPTSSAASQLELACWLFEYVRELWTEVRGNPSDEVTR